MANSEKLTGLHIYQDDKGRDVYYDIFSKKGYLLQPSTLKKYFLFKNRYIIAAALGILLLGFIQPPYLPILIGVATAIALEIYFRISFLPSLSTVKGFKPSERQSYLNRIIDNTPKGKIIMKVVLYLALSILLVVNALQAGYTGINLYFSLGLAAAGLVMSVIQVMALVKLNQRNK